MPPGRLAGCRARIASPSASALLLTTSADSQPNLDAATGMTVRQLATANRLRVLLLFQSVFRQELLRLAVLRASQRLGSAALPNIPWKGPHSTDKRHDSLLTGLFGFRNNRLFNRILVTDNSDRSVINVLPKSLAEPSQ
jgi:hypothetical protein